MACKCCSPTAPYKQYKKTNAQAYQDGVESARSWRPHWHHKPGGPYVCKLDGKARFGIEQCPDWREYCAATALHNILYRQGWDDEMQRLNPKFLQSVGGHHTWHISEAA